MRNSLLVVALAACLTVPFSLAAQGQTNTATTPVASNAAVEQNFVFPGGNLGEFVAQVHLYFDLDLQPTIPKPLLNDIRVPRMKLKTSDSSDVLELYNQVAQADGNMGRWYVVYSGQRGFGGGRGGGGMPAGAFGGGRSTARGEPNSILFIPPSPREIENGAAPVKAFTLVGMSELDRRRLLNGIEEANAVQAAHNKALGSERNWIHINQDTEILVVSGTKSYVELVSGIVEAFREGMRVRTNSPPTEPQKPVTEKK